MMLDSSGENSFTYKQICMYIEAVRFHSAKHCINIHTYYAKLYAKKLYVVARVRLLFSARFRSLPIKYIYLGCKK